MITKEQARRIAQVMFPDLWQKNRFEEIAKAIEFLHDAAGESSNSQGEEPAEEVTPIGGVVKALREAMKRQKLHVNMVARTIGVSTYTVRTWLEGKYKPNEDNLSFSFEERPAEPAPREPELVE